MLTSTRYSHIQSAHYTDDEMTPDKSLPRRCWGQHYDGQQAPVSHLCLSALSLVPGKIIVTTEAETGAPCTWAGPAPGAHDVQCLIDWQTENIQSLIKSPSDPSVTLWHELLWAVLPVWPGGQPGGAQQVGLETWPLNWGATPDTRVRTQKRPLHILKLNVLKLKFQVGLRGPQRV